MGETATIQDVAEKLGISTATVSQAFHNPWRVSFEIREKVIITSKEMGYVPKFIKKKAAYGNVGLLIDKNRGPFGEYYSHIILGILERGKELKWNISIETYDSFDVKKLPPMLTEKRVDGVILLSKHDDDFIRKLIERKIPYCVADYVSETLKHNYVIPQWQAGAYAAVTHLIEEGHRHIAMIHSPLNKGRASLERVAGFNQALEDSGIPFHPGYMGDGEFNRVKAYEVCRRLLQSHPRPTAIFCATDVMALGAYKACKEEGLSIPQDISIVGFDHIDYPYYMEHPEPELTTVNVNKQLLGAEALNIVQKSIVDNDFSIMHKTIPVQLIKKGSVSSPKAMKK